MSAAPRAGHATWVYYSSIIVLMGAELTASSANPSAARTVEIEATPAEKVSVPMA
jgi:membrane protein